MNLLPHTKNQIISDTSVKEVIKSTLISLNTASANVDIKKSEKTISLKCTYKSAISNVMANDIYCDITDNSRWKMKQFFKFDKVSEILWQSAKIFSVKITFDKEVSIAKYNVFSRVSTVPQIPDKPEMHNLYYMDDVSGVINRIINPIKSKYTPPVNDLLTFAKTIKNKLIVDWENNPDVFATLAIIKNASNSYTYEVLNKSHLYVLQPVHDWFQTQTMWNDMCTVTRFKNYGEWINTTGEVTSELVGLYKTYTVKHNIQWYKYTFVKSKKKTYSIAQIAKDSCSFSILNSAIFTPNFTAVNKWIKQLPFVNIPAGIVKVYSEKVADPNYFTKAIAADYSKIHYLKTKIKHNAIDQYATFMFYSQYVRKIFFTLTNGYIPLIGTMTGIKRLSPSSAGPTEKYEQLISWPLEAKIEGDIKTNKIDIAIRDLGGRMLEYNPRPAKNIMFNIYKDIQPLKPSYIDEIWLTQTGGNINFNNPINVEITNKNILDNINSYSQYKRKITFEINTIILPKIIDLKSEFLLVNVGRWNFKPPTFVNTKSYSALGLINVSKIKQYKHNQSLSAYHSVDFGDKEKPGTPVIANVTDSSDLKEFYIEIRDCKTLELVKFPAGKLILVHALIKYYGRS